MTVNSHLQPFFIQITLLLAAALVCGALVRKLGQAAVLGELMGGILLGPTVLGTVRPDIYLGIFPDNGALSPAIEALIKIGMLFFMFMAGLEINLINLRDHKRLVLCTSFFSGIIPFCLGYGIVWLFPQLWPQTGQPVPLALFVGTALSISALPVIARILFDLGLMSSKTGIIILSSAMINDVIGWGFFTLLLFAPSQNIVAENGLRAFGILLAYVALVMLIGRSLASPLLRYLTLSCKWPGGGMLGLTLMIMLSAAGAELAGISVIFGVFMLGIALGNSRQSEEKAEARIYDNVELFALHFFAPLYFVSVGLKANFLDQFDGILALAITAVACIGKIVGAGFGALIGKMKWREALAVGAGLNARGAVEIILASIALEQRLINQRIYVALVFMALATTVLSGFLLKLWMSNNREDSKSPHPG